MNFFKKITIGLPKTNQERVLKPIPEDKAILLSSSADSFTGIAVVDAPHLDFTSGDGRLTFTNGNHIVEAAPVLQCEHVGNLMLVLTKIGQFVFVTATGSGTWTSVSAYMCQRGNFHPGENVFMKFEADGSLWVQRRYPYGYAEDYGRVEQARYHNGILYFIMEDGSRMSFHPIS